MIRRAAKDIIRDCGPNHRTDNNLCCNVKVRIKRLYIVQNYP